MEASSRTGNQGVGRNRPRLIGDKRKLTDDGMQEAEDAARRDAAGREPKLDRPVKT